MGDGAQGGAGLYTPSIPILGPPASHLALPMLLSRIWAGHESKGKENQPAHPLLGSGRARRSGSLLFV